MARVSSPAQSRYLPDQVTRPSPSVGTLGIEPKSRRNRLAFDGLLPSSFSEHRVRWCTRTDSNRQLTAWKAGVVAIGPRVRVGGSATNRTPACGVGNRSVTMTSLPLAPSKGIEPSSTLIDNQARVQRAPTAWGAARNRTPQRGSQPHTSPRLLHRNGRRPGSRTQRCPGTALDERGNLAVAVGFEPTAGTSPNGLTSRSLLPLEYTTIGAGALVARRRFTFFGFQRSSRGFASPLGLEARHAVVDTTIPRSDPSQDGTVPDGYGFTSAVGFRPNEPMLRND